MMTEFDAYIEQQEDAEESLLEELAVEANQSPCCGEPIIQEPYTGDALDVCSECHMVWERLEAYAKRREGLR